MRTYTVSPDKVQEILDTIQARWKCDANEYTPYSASERSYEVHFRFIDIQFVTKGEEFVHVSGGLPKNPSVYNEQKDFGTYEGFPRPDATVLLHPGVFCVILPGEAHMPSIAAGDNPAPVTKFVAKVPVADFKADPNLFEFLGSR